MANREKVDGRMTRHDAVVAVLEQHRTFVGIREEPGNRGLHADFFNWYCSGGDFRDYPTGLKGAPWCATYQVSVGRLALGVLWPLAVTPAMSSVQKLAEWGAGRGIVADAPEVGDLLCVSRGGSGRWGHVAIIQTVEDEAVRTIEGNTNPSGSAEGVGVFELRRTVRETDRLLRWRNLIP